MMINREWCTGECPCKEITKCAKCGVQICHYDLERGMWRDGYYSIDCLCMSCNDENKRPK